MPELTITVRVPWPKHRGLAALEKAIFKALMAAGRQVLLLAFAAIEQEVLAEGAGARQRRRRRYLLTRFGELRFPAADPRRGPVVRGQPEPVVQREEPGPVRPPGTGPGGSLGSRGG